MGNTGKISPRQSEALSAFPVFLINGYAVHGQVGRSFEEAP